MKICNLRYYKNRTIMPRIRVTKRFNWEMSHALLDYDGLCRNLHGHSYLMYATVIGEPLDNESHPKYGMVIDFSDFKKLINELIVERFDHSVVLNKKEMIDKLNTAHPMFERLILLDYQPTCELMVADFANQIQAILPENLSLHSLRLYETATSYAEWFAEDQSYF
jgi:6-pyruvoyltetrahydropterin/6-carboxytetrahydropterin synthase